MRISARSASSNKSGNSRGDTSGTPRTSSTGARTHERWTAHCTFRRTGRRRRKRRPPHPTRVTCAGKAADGSQPPSSPNGGSRTVCSRWTPHMKSLRECGPQSGPPAQADHGPKAERWICSSSTGAGSTQICAGMAADPRRGPEKTSAGARPRCPPTLSRQAPCRTLLGGAIAGACFGASGAWSSGSTTCACSRTAASRGCRSAMGTLRWRRKCGSTWLSAGVRVDRGIPICTTQCFRCTLCASSSLANSPFRWSSSSLLLAPP
mmetsp:Transcript_26414/g.86648  ORF Transcript_26414/g.86648 Transcript_26414/m.86648 type:complete len:264 (-) Transcript_26414:92-883(-)